MAVNADDLKAVGVAQDVEFQIGARKGKTLF